MYETRSPFIGISASLDLLSDCYNTVAARGLLASTRDVGQVLQAESVRTETQLELDEPPEAKTSSRQKSVDTSTRW